jgi:hypothetical protein
LTADATKTDEVQSYPFHVLKEKDLPAGPWSRLSISRISSGDRQKLKIFIKKKDLMNMDESS